MMRPIKKGSTDQSVVIRIVDSTDGTPETGVVFNTSGIDLWYRREGATKTSITEATLATLDAAHSDGGFLHIGDGYYRLDLPDAAVATGANGVMVGGTVTGMVVIGCYVPLVDLDPYTAITVAGIADAVWDEVRSGHTTTGTFGEISTAADVADAVLDEALSGHTTAGTLGKAVSDVLDDTGTSGVVVASGSKTGYSLSSSQTFDLTGDITGNLSGSVGSVTTVSDKTGYTLSATGSAALTEGYATDGSAPTLNQMLYQIWSMLGEKSVSGTTLTTKKLDGSTTAMTFTLDDGTSPTSITRAS